MKNIISLVIVLAFTVVSIGAQAEKPQSKKTTIRWIMAHNPTNEENNTLIRDFAAKIKSLSNGELEVQPTFMDNKVADRHRAALAEVQAGRAEMSQVSLEAISRLAPEASLFNLPFFFQGHEQIKTALNSDIGSEIKASVLWHSAKAGQVEGLAFTYSGGFRVLYGSKNIQSLSDFKNLRMAWPGPNFRKDFFDQLGIQYIDQKLYSREDSVDLHLQGKVDLEDTELVRLYILAREYPKVLEQIKFAYELKHTVYLTMIVVNEKFLKSVPPRHRKLLRDEVEKLAEAERLLSIKQEGDAKAYLAAHGVKFVTPQGHFDSDLRRAGTAVVNGARPRYAKLIDKAERILLSAQN